MAKKIQELERKGYLQIEHDVFADWYLSPLNIEWMMNSWSEVFYHLQNEIEKISSIHSDYTCDCNFRSDNSEEIRQSVIERFNKAAPKYLEKLKSHLDYCKEFNQRIPAVYMHDKFYLIRFGKTGYIIPTVSPGHTFISLKDYTQLSVAEVRALKASPLEDNSTTDENSTHLATITRDQLSYKQNVLTSQIDSVNQEMDNIKEGKHEEVQELQMQIDKLMQEMEAKKEALLVKLNEKMQQFKEMKEQLNQQIFVLDSEIYSVRCFLGEVVDFACLRTGSHADINTPVVLYQKIRYLDEEMGKICSFYDIESHQLDMFERLIAQRDDVFNTFLPAQKSIALVRLSKDGERFTYSEHYHNMLDRYKLEHANTIGILIRDGDHLYIGWTDDTKVNMKEDMFYTPGKTVVLGEDENVITQKIADSNITAVVSRYFIFSILNGILHGNYENTLLSLPSDVNLLQPNEYVIYSTGDGWLEDNRFGSAADIINKCNSDIQLGDNIITVQSVRPYHSNSIYQAYCNDRGIGDRNRTHDVSAHDKTIYPINLINWNESTITYYRKPQKEEMEPSKCNPSRKVYKPDELVKDKLYFDEKTKLSDWKSFFDAEIARYNRYREQVSVVGEPELTNVETHYYVSLSKWNADSDYVYNGGRYTKRQREARANFELDPSEFINVEVMNSEWIKYLLITKKVDGVRIGGRDINYNYFIPYLNRMMEHVKERETEERELISKYLDLADYPEWMVDLSEWKLKTRHHKIGVRYAKQFADCLKGNKEK